MELLDQVEEQRPKVSGSCDGRPFQDLRDLDDLTSCVLEVLTSDGRYFWVPIADVVSIEFRDPSTPRDLLWRNVILTVRDGPEGEVFLPALYAGTEAEADDGLRLGRATEWKGGDGTPVRGVGQRTFLVGDDSATILETQGPHARPAGDVRLSGASPRGSGPSGPGGLVRGPDPPSAPSFRFTHWVRWAVGIATRGARSKPPGRSMPEPAPEKPLIPLVPSVLDRLIDRRAGRVPRPAPGPRPGPAGRPQIRPT